MKKRHSSWRFGVAGACSVEELTLLGLSVLAAPFLEVVQAHALRTGDGQLALVPAVELHPYAAAGVRGNDCRRGTFLGLAGCLASTSLVLHWFLPWNELCTIRDNTEILDRCQCYSVRGVLPAS